MFRVGDKVRNFQYGIGVVRKTGGSSLFNVHVDFNNGYTCTFTRTGLFSSFNIKNSVLDIIKLTPINTRYNQLKQGELNG
jgi:hypothetical protein